MTLAETLQQRLSGWTPSGTGRHTWSTPFEGWTVHIAADRNDSLSTLVWDLVLERNGPGPEGMTLKSWASDIAGRVSGLLEDLKVIEIDSTRDEAILRSDEPSRRGDMLGFYELRLTGLDRALLRRFKADTAAKTKREQVPFAVTHEVLGQVAEDITG